MSKSLTVLTALLIIGQVLALPAQYETLDARCEAITIPMCRGLPYNVTRFPNVLGHETQREASVEIQQFSPLVAANCSTELRQFLCSLYAPICVPMGGKLQLLKPCRHNCKRVKKGCIKLLKQFGFKWPDWFKCSLFPRKSHQALCVDWSSKATRKNRKNKKGKKGKKGKAKKRKRNKKDGKKMRSQEKKVSGGASVDASVGASGGRFIPKPIVDKVKPKRGSKKNKRKQNKKRRKTKRRKANRKAKKLRKRAKKDRKSRLAVSETAGVVGDSKSG